jgi:hypothetical protein
VTRRSPPSPPPPRRSPRWQWRWQWRWQRRWAALIGGSLLLGVCLMAAVYVRLAVLRRQIVVTPPAATLRAMPNLVISVGIPYLNAGAALSDLCFDFLKTLARQPITLTDVAQLNALYRRADQSRLCPAPVARYAFDFTRYQIIGAVTTATGCAISLTYTATLVDDVLRSQTIQLRRDVRSGCDYALVRPIWLAVERDGFAPSIEIAE